MLELWCQPHSLQDMHECINRRVHVVHCTMFQNELVCTRLVTTKLTMTPVRRPDLTR